ncbi:MAG: DNA topoisomerase [Clostridium sp.]
MGKSLFITEKPSVAKDFAKLLKVNGKNGDGYIESDRAVFTWCVGHLVTMSYPEVYDESLKKWTLEALPFLPKDYKYEVIPSVAKQFNIVKGLLLRDDIDSIYVCTDSGREGEYIYRLVDQMVGVKGKIKKRVWIDSQTEDEIKRGIKEAKELSFYDSLSDSAYLRAKEDYLVGINFSRVLTLLHGRVVSNILNEKSVVIAVGRVMSCVLGMIVEREREVQKFQKTVFYKVLGGFKIDDEKVFQGQWKAIEGSKYFQSPKLYNETGFTKIQYAEELIKYLINKEGDPKAFVEEVVKKIEKKAAPLLFNLAELQNECAKRFKINPDQTLVNVQSLYEKKMLTYPRTDARVLSTAVAKEINKNLSKLLKFNDNKVIHGFTEKILNNKWHSNLAKTKYVNDSKITDHYAIIPTGEGIGSFKNLKPLEKEIYLLVLRRFLAIFYPQAKYNTLSITSNINNERFFTMEKVCVELGYLEILKPEKKDKDEKDENESKFLNTLKKGQILEVNDLSVKEGETSPPKRYTTGTIILAMENAGKLVEDEELREHIKGSGIGTSATRAEILKKLDKIQYITVNNKTQVINASLKGEIIYEVLNKSVAGLLNPKLTASWEKGLKLVVDKEIESHEFMDKLEKYIEKNIIKAENQNNLPISEIVGNITESNRLELNKINNKIQNKIKGNSNADNAGRKLEIIAKCPICKSGEIIAHDKGFGCSNWRVGCKFFIGTIAGVTIERSQVDKLIKLGKTDKISGFLSKKGNAFEARIIIRDDSVQLDFD